MKRIRILIRTLLCVAAFTFSVGLDSYLVRAQNAVAIPPKRAAA